VNVEQQIATVLGSNVTVAGIVVDRIYPMLMPQDIAMPAISYQRIASSPVNDLEGQQNHEWVRVQVDCWALKYSEAKTLAAAVRTAMRTTPVFGLLLMELDDYDSEGKLYRVIQDFNIWN